MNNFTRKRSLRLLAGAGLMLLASLAQAQYVWVNDKGVKQFSDRPPPPSVPQSKILKAPGQQQPEPVVIASEASGDGAGAPAAESAATAPKGPPTLAERNADFRKRASERGEQEQKAAEQARRKAELADNCDSARQARAQLDSGVRIAWTDKNGERAFLSDAERAERSAKAGKVLERCR